jgi:hypothetical protein
VRNAAGVTADQARALATLWQTEQAQLAHSRTVLSLQLTNITQQQLQTMRAYLQAQQSEVGVTASVASELAIAFPDLTNAQVNRLVALTRSAGQELTDSLTQYEQATPAAIAAQRTAIWQQLGSGIPRLTGRVITAGHAVFIDARSLLAHASDNRLGLAQRHEQALTTIMNPVVATGRWIGTGGTVAWEGIRGRYNDPLAIQNITINELTADTVIITWETNRITRSKLNWGDSFSYGNEVFNDTFTATHSVELTDLTPNTNYFFEVLATDIAGDQTFDAYYGFTTEE